MIFYFRKKYPIRKKHKCFQQALTAGSDGSVALPKIVKNTPVKFFSKKVQKQY